MMASVGQLVRSDLRRRWRSLLAVALLVGLVGGLVLTAVAGARRTDSAYPRLLEALDTSDVSVEVAPEYFDEIAALPQVEAVAPASFMFVAPPELGFDGLQSLAATDERFNRLVDRPLLLEGRRARLDQVEEVLVNEEIADRLGIGAGDVLTLTSLTPDQLEQLVVSEDPGEPAGPEIDVMVVGVGRTEQDLASSSPIMVFTPAFYARYRDDVGHFDDILQVRLAHGDQDVAAFQRDVHRVVPDSEGVIVETHAETSAEIEDATQVQAVSLVVFALAAALAGFVAIGQLLARLLALSAVDQPKLHALGMTRGQRCASLLVPAVLVAFVGAVVAGGLTVLASPTMPTGFARRVEPDPGFVADWLVVGLGCVAVTVLVSCRGAVSAWSTAGRLSDASVPAGSERVVERLTRLGAPPTMVAGVRMALEPGRGRTAVPVRSALAGAVTGVAGLVAALTFGAALGWVITEPEAYGLTWDTSVIGPADSQGLGRAAAALADEGDVGAVAALSVVAIRLEGEPLQSYGLEPLKGGNFVTVLDGRIPQGADEVLVGSETLDRLGRRLGDTLVAQGLDGGTPQELTIVGRGVFPEFVHPVVPDSDAGGYNHFALLTRAASESYAAQASGEYFSMALIRWGPGVDALAATLRLERNGAALQPVERPPSFANLARVDAFPSLVASFLVLVAAVTGGHTMVTSVRRRTRDLALLKTLGFVGSQIRATVAWQATTFAAVGLALGIPAGVVIGRSAWAIVARRLGIDDHIPIPWLAIGLAVPATLVLTNLIAAPPGRRAARIRPGAVLRSE
jgi:hypothetical protein